MSPKSHRATGSVSGEKVGKAGGMGRGRDLPCCPQAVHLYFATHFGVAHPVFPIIDGISARLESNSRPIRTALQARSQSLRGSVRAPTDRENRSSPGEVGAISSRCPKTSGVCHPGLVVAGLMCRGVTRSGDRICASTANARDTHRCRPYFPMAPWPGRGVSPAREHRHPSIRFSRPRG